MKYDLKAMRFDPDEAQLRCAFVWGKTPEGNDYWHNQYKHGITPEGQAKWDAMKQQWNEENGVGQRYVVVTDDETAICNRAEAEDLCAYGVDAVYKLGDKVEVSVKVEFE